jgi:hypothetical protein
MNTQLMLSIADILEKTAAYLDEIETTQLNTKRQEQLKQASQLASKLEDITGERIDTPTIEKLSSADPELMQLLTKLASGDSLDSMGGPEATIKQANLSQRVGFADDSFVNWLLTT